MFRIIQKNIMKVKRIQMIYVCCIFAGKTEAGEKKRTILAINNNIMYGTDKSNKALCRYAERMSRCSKAWIALCEPHPGHFNPVSNKNGHLGNQIDSEGLYVKYTILPMTSPARIHVAYRISLVRWAALFMLITVETASEIIFTAKAQKTYAKNAKQLT